MATRRCFSKDIVESDVFLELPLSAQALYFHLGMNADDRGYVSNPKTVMRTIGANAGDIEMLVAKKLVLVRQETLILIKGWRIHNVIQPSRLTETKYLEDLKQLYYDENNSYTEHETSVPVLPCHQYVDKTSTECRQNADNMSTKCQPNITKDNLTKYKITKNNLTKDNLIQDNIHKIISLNPIFSLKKFYDYVYAICEHKDVDKVYEVFKKFTDNYPNLEEESNPYEFLINHVHKELCSIGEEIND